MKLFEIILTVNDSTEVYKRYDYFKSLKECKDYMNAYGMDIVRCKAVKTYSFEILKKAKTDYIEKIQKDITES